MKHWSELLPEQGKGFMAESKKAQDTLVEISNHLSMINKLSVILKNEDQRLEELALKHWTIDEIKDAQNKVNLK